MSALRTMGLAALWCLLTRELTPGNALVGLVLSALLVGWVERARRPAPSAAVRDEPVASARSALLRPLYALELGLYFLAEMVRANLRVGALLLRPGLHLRPALLRVPVEVGSERELALLSNLITLTPGTLTLDVAPDGRALYVHVMSATDPSALRRAIQHGLARRIRRLYG